MGFKPNAKLQTQRASIHTRKNSNAIADGIKQNNIIEQNDFTLEKNTSMAQ